MQLGNPIIGDGSQAGILIPGDFSLSSGRQKATVTLSPAFLVANYTIDLGAGTSGTNSYNPNWENKTANSFIVNLGTASLSGLASVTWRAEPV